MCPKDECKPFHKLECVLRQCQDCGPHMVDSLVPLTNKQESEIVTWKYYEDVVVPVKRNKEETDDDKKPEKDKTVLKLLEVCSKKFWNL